MAQTISANHELAIFAEPRNRAPLARHVRTKCGKPENVAIAADQLTANQSRLRTAFGEIA
jgi:hypothetical protein